LDREVKVVGNNFMAEKVNEKLDKLVQFILQQWVLLREKPVKIVHRRNLH
jgi:hypothetical protein